MLFPLPAIFLEEVIYEQRVILATFRVAMALKPE